MAVGAWLKGRVWLMRILPTEKLVELHGEILKEEGCVGYSEVSIQVVCVHVCACVYMCVHVCAYVYRWRTNC